MSDRPNQNVVINISNAEEKKKSSIGLIQYFTYGIVVLGAMTILRNCM